MPWWACGAGHGRDQPGTVRAQSGQPWLLEPGNGCSQQSLFPQPRGGGQASPPRASRPRQWGQLSVAPPPPASRLRVPRPPQGRTELERQET